MRDHITLANADCIISEEADFVDDDHKEYKVVFNIVDRNGSNRKYTVIVNRRHLTSAGYDGFGDSRKAAVQFATFVVKKRFTLSSPEENAAVCRGKICEYVTIDD